MNLMEKHLIIFGLLLPMSLFILPTNLLAYQVQGRLVLNEDWERKVYLSAIPSFEDLGTASEDLIVQVTEIAPNGWFELQGEGLPVQDRLYRLHVCKKGDPAATLFIGGREENHLHFVMNNRSVLTFQSSQLFQKAFILGHPTNPVWQRLMKKTRLLRQPPEPNSEVNREYRRQELEDFLIAFADTCSHPVAGQMALSQLDYVQLFKDRPGFLNGKIKAWQMVDAGSPYLLPLVQQLDVLSPERVFLIDQMGWLVGFVIAAFLIWVFIFRKKKKLSQTSQQGHADLSVQERRVLQMLSKGKSNKEISQALHIEVSTVKSHVSSIYSKLGVRSRKEVMRGQL